MQRNLHDSALSRSSAQTTQPSLYSDFSPAAQRSQVKKIACSVQGDLDTYQRVPILTTNVEKLDNLRRSLLQKNLELSNLSSQGLDSSAPNATFGGKFKSGLAVSGGVAARAGAITAASVTGVAQIGVIVAVAPVAGALSGAASGFSDGFDAPVYCAKPLTAVVGMGVGAVSGTISGTLAALVLAPVTVGLKGSIPRKTFNLVDQLPRARAYAKRRKQSTNEIALNTQRTIDALLKKVNSKHGEAEFFSEAPGELREMVHAMHDVAVDEQTARR